ncbi:LOW QUALITY PROTEIN: uncharacterized protein V1477_007257 [Vespula maculifrons]|uniref:Uncharacterized protein n=1 Tax=Vespula maculifrons TaxID=7453 RepID=A0ABD2CIY0_VESMC
MYTSSEKLNGVVGIPYHSWDDIRDQLPVNGSILLRIFTSTNSSTRCTHPPKLNGVVGIPYHSVKWRSGDTLPLVRRYKGPTDSEWFNLSTNFNEYTSIKCGSGDTLPLVRRYKGPTDSEWFNLSTNFNEYISIKCGSGDTLPLVRRYKGPTDSEWFNLSTNFNEYTSIKCGSGDTLPLKHPVNATVASIDDDFTQVQCGIIHILHILYYFFCFTLRSALWKDLDSLSPRVNLEIFTDVIRLSINEQLIQIYNNLNAKWGQSPTRDDTKLLVQLCFELRRVDLEIFTRARDFHNLSPRVDLEIFTDAIRVSINERLKNDVGLLVQLCVGLRPVNLEIFTDDIRVRINEQLIQIYNSLFDFRLKCDVGLLVQLCVELRPVNLEIFTDDIRVRINEQLIQIYNSLFDFRLKCDVGLLVQLCVELRRVNLEIFTPLRNFENLSPRVDLEIFEHLRDFENLSPRVDLEIFTPLRNFENLSPRVDLEIFTDVIRVSINEQLIQIYNNLNAKWGYTPTRDDNKVGYLTDLYIQLCFELRRVDLEIFGLSRDLDNLSPHVNLEIFAPLVDFENLSPHVDLEIFAPLVDFENLSPRVDLEIFAPLRDFENLSARVNLEIFTDVIRVSINEQLIQIYNNLNAKWGYTPTRDDNKLLVQLCFELRRVDLEIFTLARDLDNLSPRVDLEIFELSKNFDDLCPPADLDIFTECYSCKYQRRFKNFIVIAHVAMKLRAMQSLESVGSRPTSMSTYLIFNQLRIVHPQFRPKSRSSVLEPSQNFLSIVVRARSKEEAMCRRGPHKLWLKRATIRLLSYFRKFYRTLRKWLLVIAGPIIVGFLHENTTGRVSRCLKPTVWTVEQSVSGVLYISSLLRSPKLPKRKSISPVGPKVQQPPRGGTWVGDTCRYIKILWDTSIIEQMAAYFKEFSKIFSMKGMSPCFRTRIIEKTLTHDRSCLEMFEADGVDSGAICKRGFIHLQFAEKPEAPEAEKHLGSWILK